VFEQRLKGIMLGLAAVLIIIVVRLVDLQIVNADVYREQAEAALLRPAQTLPFVRGRILDRFGRVLGSDEPCWQVSVDYSVLSGEEAEARPERREEIERMWADLATFSEESIYDLQARADGIVGRIQRWRDRVSKRFGYRVPIREERMAHPVVEGLDDQRQIEARKLAERYPWVVVEHGVHRRYTAEPAWCHLLGRLAPVTAEDLREDPHQGDPLREYDATDRKGVSGVEYVAERTLRGRRGRLRYDRSQAIVEHVPAEAGDDVTLTIRSDLQDALYRLLDERIPELCPYPAGGVIVVVHVPSREILAMVSYPGFDNNEFSRRYRELRADMVRTPLRFRAAANAYEPGSIVKPLTCIAGLGTEVITPDSTFTCTGYYFPNVRDAWRCWQVTGTNRRRAHGEINVSAAIAGSCNVFMYHVGELVGVDRLTGFFEMAGFGEPTGVGLREEREGINPTPSWLMTYRNAPATRGRARNFAIGQGELSITPLQAANLFALYASGAKKALQLVRDDTEPPTQRLPVKPHQWRAVREGLFRVTNDPGGTAYRTAHWTNGRYALCGKTGSATTPATPTHYQIEYQEGGGRLRFAIVAAKTRHNAAQEFRREHPEAEFDARDVVPCAWYPPKRIPGQEKYAHAWFGGYLQPVGEDGRPLPDRTPPVAFAVLVEFGSSGGHVSGPLGQDVARILCDMLGPELDPDFTAIGGVG
jgi:penicillin-binding protein 2